MSAAVDGALPLANGGAAPDAAAESEEQKIKPAGVEGAQQGKVKGIIQPPPEIRAVADKTARFVAKNGKSFEDRILNSEEGRSDTHDHTASAIKSALAGVVSIAMV